MATGWKVHALHSINLGIVPASVLDVYNGSSSRVLRVYRVSMFASSQSVGSTAVVNFKLNRTSQSTGARTNTAAKPCTMIVPYNPGNAVLDSSITAGGNRSTTVAATIRNYVFSFGYNIGYPASLGMSGNPTLTMTVPFAEVWRVDYDDPNLQPLVARPGQGYDLVQATNPPVGADIDAEMEFTDEAV